MAVNYTYNDVSIANFIDKIEVENEDYVKVNSTDNSFVNFVICDGAGGAGVFSKEWAQYLAERIPATPLEFENSSQEWFSKTARGFHDTVIFNKKLTDLMLNKKVYRDGSYSTFCSCWLDLNGNKLHYSVIGDSYLFILKKCEGNLIVEEIAPIQYQQNFDENPELLNWINELQSDIPFKSFTLEHEYVILMASDGLAKWIILNLILLDPESIQDLGISQNYMNSLSQEKNLLRKELIAVGSGNKTVAELFVFLKEISGERKKFESALKELYNNGEIEIDDYSLIYIEANVS